MQLTLSTYEHYEHYQCSLTDHTVQTASRPFS